MATLSDRMEVKSLKSNSDIIWLVLNSSLETALLAANLNDRVFLTMVLEPLDNFACFYDCSMCEKILLVLFF